MGNVPAHTKEKIWSKDYLKTSSKRFKMDQNINQMRKPHNSQLPAINVVIDDNRY